MNHISSNCEIESARRRCCLLAIVFALAGALIAGCVPLTPDESDTAQSLSCAKFVFSHWMEFDLGLDSSPDDLFATVLRLYEIDREQLRVEIYPEGQIHIVHWADSNVDYSANFSVGGRLTDIAARWGHERPTLSQVIDCLGPPARPHEESGGGGPEEKIFSYWAHETGEEARIPGFITTLVIEGISSPDPELSSHTERPDYRLQLLTVRAVPEPRLVVESLGPSSCAKLSPSHWQEFSFGVDSPDDVVATVVRLWGMDREQVQVGGSATERFPPVRWSDAEEEIIQTAYFPDGQLGSFFVLFDPALALTQVIDCLGSPEYYITGGGPGDEGTSLFLWYVEKGFVIAGIAWHRWPWQKPLEGIPPDFGLDSFHVLPGGIEQMARSFNYLDDEGNPIMCIFKPWPGSIEAIEISAEPFFACYHSDTD